MAERESDFRITSNRHPISHPHGRAIWLWWFSRKLTKLYNGTALYVDWRSSPRCIEMHLYVSEPSRSLVQVLTCRMFCANSMLTPVPTGQQLHQNNFSETQIKTHFFPRKCALKTLVNCEGFFLVQTLECDNSWVLGKLIVRTWYW